MYAIEQAKRRSTRFTEDTPIQRIVILVAMMDEAAPMIQTLGLQEEDLGLNPHLKMRCFTGKLNERRIDLVVNGDDPELGVARVGTESATLCTYEVINRLDPDTIVSAGTAGGYAHKGAQVGDIYIATKHFSFHDRRIPLNPNYEAYSRGQYPCLEAPALASALNLKLGIISSGNSLTVSLEDQANIDAIGSVAKEMEVAAIAKVAKIFNVRVLGAKVITNLAGVTANAEEQFEQNFKLATTKLAYAMPGILRHLLDSTPRQLQNLLSLVQETLPA